MNPSAGGPCQGIRNSIPELERLGVRNEVVSMDSPSAAFLGKDPFLIHAVGRSKGPWAYAPQLMSWLIGNLSGFDVVIIHGLWLYHGYAVRKALKQLAKTGHKTPRCYVMPHGMLDPYFQRDPSRRLKAMRNTLYWKFVENKVVNDADGVLFTCKEELELARQPFRPYAPKQETNIGYGVAEPPVATASMRISFAATLPASSDRPYLLFLSRIHPKKGVDLLIRAYAKLAKSHDSSDSSSPANPFPSLVIAGPLDSPYAAEMQELAVRLFADLTIPSSGGSPGIHFVGMLQGDAKWGAFHGCEAFVLPSHQENFGIAVVEALACGKPVLISDQVNIWREIVHAGGGLVGKDSEQGTFELLVRWIESDGIEKRHMSENALKSYARHFEIKSSAARLCGFLRDGEIDDL